MGLFSSNKTSTNTTVNTTTTNQQVAAESGIALGAGASGNTIVTADPEIVGQALATSEFISGRALQTVDASNDRLSAVHALAIQGHENLATKYMEAARGQAQDNIAFLQNVADNQFAALDKTLDESFGIAKSVAPQDAAYSVQELSRTTFEGMTKIAIAGVAILGLVFTFFLLKKKAA